MIGGRTISIKCLGIVTHSYIRIYSFVFPFVFWNTAPALFGSIIAFMRVYQGIWECISLILWGGITRLLVVVTMRTYKGKERKCGKIFIIVLLPIVPPHPHLDLIFKLITGIWGYGVAKSLRSSFWRKSHENMTKIVHLIQLSHIPSTSLNFSIVTFKAPLFRKEVIGWKEAIASRRLGTKKVDVLKKLSTTAELEKYSINGYILNKKWVFF